MLGLSTFYALAAGLAWFAALFTGIKAAVLAMMLQAAPCASPAARSIPTSSAFWRHRRSRGWHFSRCRFRWSCWARVRWAWWLRGCGLNGWRSNPARRCRCPCPACATAATILLWLLVWALPLALVLAFLGDGHVLWKIGLFFSQLAW